MRKLFLVLILIWAHGAAIAEKRIALIIANSNYETAGWDLLNPINDAALMQSALREVGFEVHLLIDGSRHEMEQAFQLHGERLEAAGENSTGLFFYAGHGVQSEGLNYLIPVDAEAYSEADVWAQAPRLENLMSHLRLAGNERNFIILDACRNNPLLSSVRGFSRGLAGVSEANGTFIAYATAPGNVAEDGQANSPYSTVLASLITEPGQSVETLFRRVRTRVEKLTNNRQRPWSESGLSGENDFCFAGCHTEPMLSDDEQMALGQALQSNTLAAYSEFKQRFPSSRSIELIDAQIGNLNQSSFIAPSDERAIATSNDPKPMEMVHSYDDGRVKLTITGCRNPTNPFCRLRVQNYSNQLLRVGLKVGMTSGWDQNSNEMRIYRAVLGGGSDSGVGGVAWANIPSGGQQEGLVSFRERQIVPPVTDLMLLQLYLIVGDERTTIEFEDLKLIE